MSSLRRKRDGYAKRVALAQWRREQPRQTKQCEMAGCRRAGDPQLLGYCRPCWEGPRAA